MKVMEEKKSSTLHEFNPLSFVQLKGEQKIYSLLKKEPQKPNKQVPRQRIVHWIRIPMNDNNMIIGIKGTVKIPKKIRLCTGFIQ
jgi:hypothetical protein